jgi:hypothetical protein
MKKPLEIVHIDLCGPTREKLNDSKLSNIFWGKIVHTTIHILNMGLIIRNSDKTPYELWKGRPTNVKHF